MRLLEDCWQTTLAGRRDPFLRLDLTAVTSIDAAGRGCLTALHPGGVEFIAADWLAKAVVAEITHGPSPESDCGPPKWGGVSTGQHDYKFALRSQACSILRR